MKLKVNNLEDESGFFKWGDVKFEEMENKKMKCGLCQEECLMLISHPNGSPECSINVNMVEFKITYAKGRGKKN